MYLWTDGEHLTVPSDTFSLEAGQREADAETQIHIPNANWTRETEGGRDEVTNGETSPTHCERGKQRQIFYLQVKMD